VIESAFVVGMGSSKIDLVQYILIIIISSEVRTWSPFLYLTAELYRIS